MTKPNLVLVVLDDVIADDLESTSRAPNWHDLQALGTEYRNAYAMPVCSQSRACLLFGRYGRDLGITRAMSGADGPEPPADAQTLPGLLRQEAGYATALVGKWHLGRHPVSLTSIGAPLGRGYDRWLAGSIDNLDSYTAWQRHEDCQPPVLEHGYATQVQMDAARAWWTATRWPKFMHIALAAPHAPFHNPPAELLEGYAPSAGLTVNRQRYLKMIRSADWALGQLRTFPGMENSLVCVVSDNGTPQNATGVGQDPGRVKTTTYEDGVRIAMAWYGPGVAAAAEDHHLTHLVDVPHAFLVAAGVAPPLHWGGMDPIKRTHAISEATLEDGTHERAIITSTGFKLRRTGSGPEELFYLHEDPFESTNLVAHPDHAKLVVELRRLLLGA